VLGNEESVVGDLYQGGVAEKIQEDGVGKKRQPSLERDSERLERTQRGGDSLCKKEEQSTRGALQKRPSMKRRNPKKRPARNKGQAQLRGPGTDSSSEKRGPPLRKIQSTGP